MRWYEWTAAATFALTAVASGWIALAPPQREGAPGPTRSTTPTLEVRSALALHEAEVRVTSDAADAGRIRFEVEAPLRVVGVTTAMALRVVEGRPRLTDGRPLQTVQAPDGTLNVRSWMKTSHPSGPHALRFALRCEGPQGVEYRLGYAKLNPADLATGGLVVRPRRQGSARIVAKTLDDVALPGAVVVVGPRSLPLSALSGVVVTEADGSVTVSGLDRDGEWTASLPEGIGPDRAPVEAGLATDGSIALLVVQLRGTWAFERIRVDRALEGMTEVVEGLLSPSSPIPTVWPVTMCAVAGSGSGSPIVLLRRPDTPIPADLEVRFKGRAPLPVQKAADGTWVLGPALGGLPVREGGASEGPRPTPSTAQPRPDAPSR